MLAPGRRTTEAKGRVPTQPHGKPFESCPGSLKDVGAVSADADDVLQDRLVIGRAARPVSVVLQAEAAELAGVVFEHPTCATRRNAKTVHRAAGEQAAIAI